MAAQINTPLSPSNQVDETVAPQPTGPSSPGRPIIVQRAVHPFGDAGPAVSSSLDALIAELQALRLSRQEETTRSEERFGRIESWMRRQDGGPGIDGSSSGPLGGPQVVSVQHLRCHISAVTE